MHRSALNIYEKPEKVCTMRDASSASPSGSLSALNAEGTAQSSSSLPPPPLQRCICINCSKQMRIAEPDLQRAKEESDGRSRNLIDFIASAAVPMEAPVCKECADSLQNSMARQMEMLERDCITYGKLIDDLKTRHSNVDVADCQAKIERLKREEYELAAELRTLILEEEKVDRDLAAQKRSLENTSEEEEKLWRKLRDYHTYMIENDQEVREVNMEIRYIDSQLKMLTRTSVLSLAFPIESLSPVLHSPPLASINGFRLGRLPSVQIEWPEINAAWGQALLLLDILMKRAHCQLREVEFVTLHASSYIRRGMGREMREYPLHATGSWKPFGVRSNMDGGASIFVEALQLLIETITERARKAEGVPIVWPYKIRGDKIIDAEMEYSVKMQFSSEERWTRAMHGMLTNLKWAAAMFNIDN